MAEEQKIHIPVSETDSRTHTGVSVSRDPTTPTFTTADDHGLSVGDIIYVTKSTSEVITGEGEFLQKFNEWAYETGKKYTVAGVGEGAGELGKSGAASLRPKRFIVEGVFNTVEGDEATVEYHSASAKPEPEVEEAPAPAAAATETPSSGFEWKPYQIAAAGEIQALADSAEALATTVKETLTLANLGMSAVKLLAELQSINPLLIALEALADEILKEIDNLKKAGFYYLIIDPYYIKNVTPSPAFTYGFEQLRDEGGKRIFLTKIKDAEGNPTGEWDEQSEAPPIFPKQEQITSGDVKPFLATPRKLIPGGYNPYENSLIDPLASISPYPKFSTAEVIEQFGNALTDEGDVPRYKYLGNGPKTGTVVYDADGEPFSGWDTTKDFGLQLYDVGLANQTVDYKIEQKKINSIIQFGKPESETNGAIAIIIAAPSFDVFTEAFNAFSKMFSDIPDFAASTGKSLADSFLEILTPNDVVIKLTQVDTKYGQFAAGDVIGGEKYGGLAEVASVNASSVIATTMTAQKEVRMTNQLREEIKYITTVDMNPNERWIDMEVTAKPIRSADGLNPFIPGDDVYEQEKRGDAGFGDDLFPNYVTKGKNTVQSPLKDRVYPKCGKVSMEKLAALPDSTPPDFGGIQIQHLIPAWGDFFSMLENFVKQLKGMISDSAAFIQDIIDMIKDIEKFLEDLVKTIVEFLEFFSVTLPSTGVYAIEIANQDGGPEGLKGALSGASGLPDLAYAAGILFVGTGGPTATALLSNLLQIKG